MDNDFQRKGQWQLRGVNNDDCNDDSVDGDNLQVQVWLPQSLPELLCGHLASLPSTLRHLQGKLLITGWPFSLYFG